LTIAEAKPLTGLCFVEYAFITKLTCL
jgi:hypothetical protein